MADHSKSVVDEAVRIHSSVTGSGDHMADEELRERSDWLRARVTDGWELPHNNSASAYDTCVRRLALAAVAVAERHLKAAAKG